MDALSSLVPVADRAPVRAKARWLAESARAWAAGEQADLPSATYDNLSLVVSAMAPALPREDLLPLVRYGVWTLLFDDRLDATDASAADLRHLQHRVHAVVSGRPPVRGFLISRLTHLLADFRDRDRDGFLAARLGAALYDGVSAAVEQVERSRRVAGGVPPPDTEEYLRLASRDVHYRAFAIGLLILVGDRPDAGVVDRLDAALVPACTAVRLANDLRSFARDERERRLNILMLRDRDGAWVTVPDIERRIGQLIEAHLRLVGGACDAGTAASQRALADGLRIAVGLYRVGDLR
jgi:hypothetical protein